MTEYQHSQTGSAILYAISLPGLILLAVGACSPAARPVFFIGLVLLLSALLFWKLTIKIDNQTLRASFGIGLIQKTISIADIAECEAIRIRWWWGWGIHFTPYGWLYNVSGLDAIVVTLRDGRSLCLGTDQPDELVAAIRRVASVR